MGFKCGIVGLPNVGKSTLFNALTKTASAQVANYPFCTIEPNTGDVGVPDPRLEKIAKIAESANIIPTRLTFVDIAGLVRGASKGEGLGNQFLANIREIDAIAHVLRCFEDSEVTHVEGRIDPIADAATVETELMLADLESLEKRIVRVSKQVQTGDKEAKTILPIMRTALDKLQDGLPVRILETNPDDKKLLESLNLLTSKPVLYICNVEEESAVSGNKYSELVQDFAKTQNAGNVIISAAIEEEIAQLEGNDQKEFIEGLGLTEPGLDRLIRAGYDLLDLITYFTAGPKETRAWTITKGTKAPKAAGEIHTDFEKGFIRAQTIAYQDFVNLGGESAAKDAGKARDEGKDYIVVDGDIMLFKFNT